VSAALRRVLVAAWTRRGPLAWMLWPLSLLYGLAVTVRTWLYGAHILKSEPVPVPVIVVGNVVAGGGGKTPLVLAIVEHLQNRGKSVGVVSRGYGRAGSDCREVYADSAAGDVGDEPLLIKRSTGARVFVAPRRIDAARALLLRNPALDVLVCDDGLQHLALQRDMEICAFDRNGVGNGLLLPAGPLRERWPRPVDLLVCDSEAALPGCWPVRRSLGRHARRADGVEATLQTLGARAQDSAVGLWAVAGIARPDAFFAMLRNAGLTLAHTIALPDHAAYDDARWHCPAANILLCTEKDAVKLWQFRPDAWAVPLQLALDAEFWTHFDKILEARTEAKLSSAHGYTTA